MICIHAEVLDWSASDASTIRDWERATRRRAVRVHRLPNGEGNGDHGARSKYALPRSSYGTARARCAANMSRYACGARIASAPAQIFSAYSRKGGTDRRSRADRLVTKTRARTRTSGESRFARTITSISRVS